MAIALLCVPISLLLALVLPGNRMLPFGDLAALPFYILWGVAASRGNMVRGLINSIFILAGILWIGTSLAPLTTELARAAHFAPEGLAGTAGHYREWSGLALGSHIVPWIVLSLFRPGAPSFLIGVAAAAAYGGIWWWVRGEIRSQYADQIAAKAATRAADLR
jgi:PTS system galactitol-specific IIC component